LNGAAPVMLGRGDDGGRGYQTLLPLLDKSPAGLTPLCFHVAEIANQITALAPQLLANNQRVVVVIATDGEASDGNIAEAMAPLQALPVLVVIRLCTSEEPVVQYWNSVDQQLELELDVLDDFESEAKEIAKVNSWFTYGEPLHRLREFGITIKEMDQLDEAPLLPDQIRKVAALIMFGNVPPDMPPTDDLNEFMNYMQPRVDALPVTWCPLLKSQSPWIRLTEMETRI